MAAPRATAGLLGLVLALALSAGLSPAAASRVELHEPHGIAGDVLAGDHVLELLREAAQEVQARPEPPGRPAFTLWPAPPPENGHLFARAPEPPRLELALPAPSIASEIAETLPETRIRAFGLFDPILHPGSNRVSRENATGYALGLWRNRVGPTQKGLWTDPVTGHSYARARWLDTRNASWLSEDPLGAVDSTNLYAFVAWQPNMSTDPRGLCVGDLPCPGWARDAIDRGKFNLYVQWETAKGVASDTGHMVVGAADFITLGQSARARASVQVFFNTEGTLVERGNAANEAGNRAQLAVVTLGFSEAEDKSQHLEDLVGIQAVQDSGTLLGTAWVEGDPELLLEGAGKLAEGSGQIAGTVLLVYAPAEAGISRLRTAAAPSTATRAEALLRRGPGVNVTAKSDALSFRQIIAGGRPGAGTPLTDLAAIEEVIGRIPAGSRMTISSAQAVALEDALGLPAGRLGQGGILSMVDDVALRAPRSPMSGNQLFLGGGRGLPGGGPEINVAPISTAGGGGIRQVILDVK